MKKILLIVTIFAIPTLAFAQGVSQQAEAEIYGHAISQPPGQATHPRMANNGKVSATTRRSGSAASTVRHASPSTNSTAATH